MRLCCRPQYNWGSHVVRAYWVFFKTEEERRRALAMSGQYLVSHPLFIPEAALIELSTAHTSAVWPVLGPTISSRPRLFWEQIHICLVNYLTASQLCAQVSVMRRGQTQQ